MRRVYLYGIVLSLTAYISAAAFESAPSMLFVGSNYSGHEEITRQALTNVSKKIIETDSSSFFDTPDLKFDLEPEPKGLFGYKSRNMVIHGNFASDFPNQTRILSLAKFWNNDSFGAFDNPRNQVIHFLRNYKNAITLDSAKATCMLARENIKHISEQAIKLWDIGQKSQAFFLIGHATHIIQDSFSRAHAQRDDESNNYNLKNICFFGTEMYKKIDLRSKDPQTQICYHGMPDSKDIIWNMKSGQSQQTSKEWSGESSIECNQRNLYPETEEQKRSCMNHEARLARVATEKYLFLVFNQINPEVIVKKSTADFLRMLDSNLFDGPVGDVLLDQKMPAGILRCDGLSDKEIVGSEPIDNNW